MTITQSQISDLDHYNSTDFGTDFALKTTTDLTEGTNLYYTNARVDAHLTGGTGVTYSAGTISIGQDVGVTANVNFHNLTLDGNLTVNGTTTTVNTDNLAVSDNMIYLADGNTTANIDLGWAGNYNDGTYAHAGLFRDASDGRFKVYDGYTLEPDASPDIDTTHASFNLAPFQAGSFIGPLTGNVTGTVSDISNHNTDNLTEGSTNLYYTDGRVQAYLTANNVGTEVNDLTAAVTWANVPDANITQSSVTQHQAALSITESQISDLQSYALASAVPSSIGDLTDVDLSTAPTDGQILHWDNANGVFVPTDKAAPETLTTIALNGNSLDYTDENGTTTNISLAAYLDDTTNTVLSAALSGTTITFTREDSTTFTLDVTNLYDDTNLVTSVNGAQGAVTLGTDDVAEGVTNLYHTDARALAATDGEIVKFANMFATVNDLPNATTYHGMFAHVHATGKGYFAHAGNWVELANVSEIPTVPSSIDDLSDVDITTAAPTSGQVLKWNGSAFVPADDTDTTLALGSESVDALSDVDTTSTAPTNGQALVWDGSNWVPGTVAASGGSSVTVSDTAPSSPSEGDMWFDSANLVMMVYYDGFWVEPTSIADNFTVVVGDAAPSAVSAGALWWNSTDGNLYVYYNDGDSTQWVQANSTDISLVLNDLTNVSVASPTDGQALVWNATNSQWEAGTITSGTSYTDADVDARVTSQLTHFHSSFQTVTSQQATDNTTQTVDFTFSELTDAVHYQVFINRFLLRPTEVTVSGTTVTCSIGLLTTDDEIEVVGLSY